MRVMRKAGDGVRVSAAQARALTDLVGRDARELLVAQRADAALVVRCGTRSWLIDAAGRSTRLLPVRGEI